MRDSQRIHSGNRLLLFEILQAWCSSAHIRRRLLGGVVQVRHLPKLWEGDTARQISGAGSRRILQFGVRGVLLQSRVQWTSETARSRCSALEADHEEENWHRTPYSLRWLLDSRAARASCRLRKSVSSSTLALSVTLATSRTIRSSQRASTCACGTRRTGFAPAFCRVSPLLFFTRPQLTGCLIGKSRYPTQRY